MKKKTVVIGVSSGIAAYKTLALVQVLKQQGMDVWVVMTKHAAEMVSPSEFEKVSKNKVYSNLFEQGFDYKTILKSRAVDHIALADRADVMVIAPVTANILAKIAHGIADDFLTTTVLAVTAPIILCPSMNVHMWHNPVVQRNISLLQEQGYHIIEPDSGMLACGYEGKGRLAAISIIKQEVDKLLTYSTSLKGKRMLVTAGATRENIDSIRFITNRSSGKMGAAIAEECYLRGANVHLLRAKSAVSPRYHINESVFSTADELLILIKKHIKKYDMLFHTAAISDFTVKNPHQGKISSKKPLQIQLAPRPKILDMIKKMHSTISLIAWKAEYGLSEDELTKVAFKRLQESNADAMIANDVSSETSGFDVDMNEVMLVLKDGTSKKIHFAKKRDIAKQIIDCLREKILCDKPLDS